MLDSPGVSPQRSKLTGVCHSGFKIQIDSLLTGFFMHLVDVPVVFKLSPHKFPATVFAPLSKFQHALKYFQSPHLWWCPTLLFLSQVILTPLEFDRVVVTQRIQFPPTQIEKKNLGQDKIPGIHSAITIILIK